MTPADATAPKSDDRTNSTAHITRREMAARIAGAAALGAAISQNVEPVSAQTPPANTVLDIADWSYHFYGVEHATLARGTICNGMQMYVEHWIPTQRLHPYPIVLIHGGYGQGSNWLSTPDGRRGWVSLLLEQGYSVYLVDRPGQGRNPYFPWVHGYFDDHAPTFENTASQVKSAQWPGSGDGNDPSVVQLTASLGQPMANGAFTQHVWRTRGAMLLDQIGPAILLTHGDGASFALVLAQERLDRVKGIVAIEPTDASFGGQDTSGLANLPILILTAESRDTPAIAQTAVQSKAILTRISLTDRGIRGNGPMLMLEKNNRETMAPVLEWLKEKIDLSGGPQYGRLVGNRESTALKLADQGGFWVGAQRKKMPYGTIAQGQMFVQYMIPAERRHPYPVVMVHGGGGQGTHMMGLGGRPGWVHYFVQAGYAVYWLDRPSYGRSPYHPDALGPSHLRNVPALEGLVTTPVVFNTAQWPGPGGMNDPYIDQFMACESGNTLDEAFHSQLVWPGGAELLDRIGPSILLTHAFGGFFAWGVADRRPHLVKAVLAMEPNGNPFKGQFRWGLTAAPMTYDPPVTDPAQFVLVDKTPPAEAPIPVVSPYKLQAEPAHKWKNLQGLPVGWLTTEFGAGGSPMAQVPFLKQVGCKVDLLRLRDYGIVGNGNLMLMEKNNHEIFGVCRDWLSKNT